MKPVVLIERTPSGSAFTYSRVVAARRGAGRERTHVVQTEPVPVGVPLPALNPDDVELLRAEPELFFA